MAAGKILCLVPQERAGVTSGLSPVTAGKEPTCQGGCRGPPVSLWTAAGSLPVLSGDAWAGAPSNTGSHRNLWAHARHQASHRSTTAACSAQARRETAASGANRSKAWGTLGQT